MIQMQDTHLEIGALIFPQIDQIDFTGPFEVLSRLSNSNFHVIGQQKTPVRDEGGLILTPGKTLSEAPLLDVLIVPGGLGVNVLMEDAEIISFIRRQVVAAKYVFSICTGALLCGAAGLLKGVRATTHWRALSLLQYFGAIPIDERVVIDGKFVSAAGVTAGIDGALRVAALLRGDDAARRIQLFIQYAPEPPFDCGTPKDAPAGILKAVEQATEKRMNDRVEVVRRVAARLGGG